MFQNFGDFENVHKKPKIYFFQAFFHLSLAKNFLLAYFQENVTLKLMKNNENLYPKSYSYINTPRDKTIKAARLKIHVCIGKCISELKKTAAQ
jgi:hypothetical protein